MTVGKSQRESDDNYCREIVRFAQYRLIDGACGIQWVIQKPDGQTKSGAQCWTGRSYARTRDTIIRRCWELGGPIEPEVLAILLQLPDRHPRWSDKPTSAKRKVDGND